MVHDERSEIAKPCRRDSASRAGYAEAGEHSSASISDGRPNASQSGLMLFIVDRITSVADLCQFFEQSGSLSVIVVDVNLGRPSEMTLSMTEASWNAKAALPEAEQ